MTVADLAQMVALALTVQSAAGTYNAPSSADCYPVANLRPTFDGITADNPEYLGTVHRPGATVFGKTVTLTFNIMLRPPGGSAPPAAGAFIPGRVLRAAGFTENVVAAAIPASAEALGAATTSNVTLGDGAAATANLYKGLVANLEANGTIPRSYTALRSYGADKVAKVPEVFGSPPTGNYQIPPQLAYQLSSSASTTLLSASFWLGSRRYNCVDMTVSGLRFTFPAATREGVDFPVMEVTITGDLYSDADEAAPTLTPLGAIPTFKDGDFWVAGKPLGGSSFSVDMGLRVGYPPNPNKVSGNDAPQITQTTRTVSLTLNQQLKATIDLIALADAQSYHAVWAQYGYVAGAIVSFLVTDARFNYQSPDPGGDFVTTTGEMLIDGSDKVINLVFPYA
jgi:hypothetical protein